MAKLYWRIKKNGKWTWRPAVLFPDGHGPVTTVRDLPLEAFE